MNSVVSLPMCIFGVLTRVFVHIGSQDAYFASLEPLCVQLSGSVPVKAPNIHIGRRTSQCTVQDAQFKKLFQLDIPKLLEYYKIDYKYGFV